jgi:transposase
VVVAKVQKQFQRIYPDVHLNKMTISRVLTPFHETGSVQDKKNKSGQPSVLTAGKLENVQVWLQ